MFNGLIDAFSLPFLSIIILLTFIDHVELKGSETASKKSELLPPIILVPGFMATKLFIKGNASGNLHGKCPPHFDYQKAWISRGFLDQKMQECLFNVLSLAVKEGKSVDKNPSIKVDTLGNEKFGSIVPVKCLFLDSTSEECAKSVADKNDEANYGPLVQWLTDGENGFGGYAEGLNLFAAPYDWRYEFDSAHLNEFYANLTKLIEEVSKNGKKKIILVMHSMGNLIGNHYMNRHPIAATEDWQKKHLAATINVAAPFGGSVEVIEEILSGNANRYFDTLAAYVSDSAVLPFARSLGSIATMLPNTLAFAHGDEFVHNYGTRNYGMAQMEALLKASMTPHFHKIQLKSVPKAPVATKMHCIYGTGTETPLEYDYAQRDEKGRPKVTAHDAGDGVVNLKSLRVCRTWKGQGKNVDKIVELADVKHGEIIHHDDFYHFIGTIIREEMPKA